MTNDQTAMLARYGIDYAEAMERFCGNESLFARIAVKYLDDPHVDALEAALASGARPAREPRCRAGSADEPGRVGTFNLDALAGIEAEAPTLSPSHGRTARSSRLRPIQCPPR